jgi:diguanylate cyclase (GGDEF)-like protein
VNARADLQKPDEARYDSDIRNARLQGPVATKRPPARLRANDRRKAPPLPPRAFSSTGAARQDDPAIAGLWMGSARATTGTALILLCFVTLIPASAVALDPTDGVARGLLGVSVTILAYAAFAHLLSWRGGKLAWLPYLSVLVYTSAVSLAAIEILGDVRLERLGWLSIPFMLYILIVGATSLRNDVRTAWFAGILGFLQLTGVTFHALQFASEVGGARSAAILDEFEPVRTAARFALLLCATVLAASVARRGRLLQQRSVRDGLTGLLNRRVFDELLERQQRRAETEQRPISIAVIDLDYFKQINDRCGHTGGDAVLRQVGEVLRQAFRDDDFVARYGGEEFVAVLPDTGEDVVLERLESLRKRVEALPVTDPRTGEPLQLSISIGVASWPDDGEHLGHVFREADRRLYAAKDAGRNRVVSRGIAPEPVPVY